MGPGVVRAEAGRPGCDLVRAAHDHERPFDEERGRRRVLAAARRELRRHRRRWDYRLRGRKAILGASRHVSGSRSVRAGRALLVQNSPQSEAPGGAEFIPELIHNRSGTGSDVFPVDLDKDGRLDVVTATRFGTFIFWNNLKVDAPRRTQ